MSASPMNGRLATPLISPVTPAKALDRLAWLWASEHGSERCSRAAPYFRTGRFDTLDGEELIVNIRSGAALPAAFRKQDASCRTWRMSRARLRRKVRRGGPITCRKGLCGKKGPDRTLI